MLGHEQDLTERVSSSLIEPNMKRILITVPASFSNKERQATLANEGCRSSHGSTITLSGKPLEVAAVETENGLTRLADENSRLKCNRIEKHKDKESDKSAVQLMRKILKGRKGSRGTIDNASADKKLNKVS
nr:hypothetical protein [Tanacetum cinerariifolium]